MADKNSGWKCTHETSISYSSDKTSATITVTCYWQNNGWRYDLNNGVTAKVYCNGKWKTVKSSGGVNASSSNTQKVKLGSETFKIGRGTSDKSITCKAEITSNSSYVSGTKKSTATSVTVKAKPSYTVSYNANGGTGAPASQKKYYGTAITLSSTKPTRTGYAFIGWGSSPSSTSPVNQPGGTYTGNANYTYYAIWKANAYTVSYNANGGYGAPSSQTKEANIPLTLSYITPYRNGYNFVGWGSSSSSTSPINWPGGTYTANANCTYYAIWEETNEYRPSMISNVDVRRCNSEGIFDDCGTYAHISFRWTRISGQNVSVTIRCIENGDQSTTVDTINKTLYDSSGIIDVILGDDSLSIEHLYDIMIEIIDSGGNTDGYKATLSTANFPIDLLVGGNGVAIGKVAETPDLLDIAYRTKFTGGIEYVCIPYDTDLNTITTPGFYCLNHMQPSQYNEYNHYKNVPVDLDDGRCYMRGTATLRVESVGPEGQIRQIIDGYDKDDKVSWKFERYYYEDLWGDWIRIGGQRCLWSGYSNGGLTMTSTESIGLYEPISAQHTGIVLLFNYRNADESYNSVFIHKSIVSRHPNKGHSIFLTRGNPFEVIGSKYLYIGDEVITGHNNNAADGNPVTSRSLHKVYNGAFKLLAVFGV